MNLQRQSKLNRKVNNGSHSDSENYYREEVYLPASSAYILTSLIIALTLNLFPLQQEFLIFRPDFVAITLIYWCVNESHKMSMSIAFIMGLMMDAGNTSILGQHALAYCVAAYLALVLGRRLRIFNLMQQAPQVGLILFVMQAVIVLVAIAGGSSFPGWQYFSATISGILLWAPIAVVISMPLKQKPDPDAL